MFAKFIMFCRLRYFSRVKISNATAYYFLQRSWYTAASVDRVVRVI